VTMAMLATSVIKENAMICEFCDDGDKGDIEWECEDCDDGDDVVDVVVDSVLRLITSTRRASHRQRLRC